eukprot:10463993-Prorocentrum_lima.AAC.1
MFTHSHTLGAAAPVGGAKPASRRMSQASPASIKWPDNARSETAGVGTDQVEWWCWLPVFLLPSVF